MNNSSKILLIFVTLALFLLLSLGTFLFYSMGSIVQDITLIRGRLSTLDSEIKNINVIEGFLEKTASDRIIISQGFIGNDDLLRFIEDIEKVGNESGIEVNVESASLAAGNSKLGPSFRLRAQGNFSQVFKYMLLLENTPYEISFEDISFTSSAGEKGKKNWLGTFVIRLLSYES